MSFIRLKIKGKNIDVRAADITAYLVEDNGTTLLFNTGGTLQVDESFQAVRNRVAKAEAGADFEE